MRRRALLSLLVADVLVVLGIVLAVAAGRARESSIATPPGIVGEITLVTGTDGGATIIVEEHPGSTAGAKAEVRTDGSTRWWGVSGAPAELRTAVPGAVGVGTRVAVYFDGPVAMSYPLQGRAVIVDVRPR